MCRTQRAGRRAAAARTSQSVAPAGTQRSSVARLVCAVSPARKPALDAGVGRSVSPEREQAIIPAPSQVGIARSVCSGDAEALGDGHARSV